VLGKFQPVDKLPNFIFMLLSQLSLYS